MKNYKWYWSYGVDHKVFMHYARMFYKNKTKAIIASKMAGLKLLTQKLQQKMDESNNRP
jgi:hypothetical protein